MPNQTSDAPAAVHTAAHQSSWPADIYRARKAWDIRQVADVPDAGHKWLIARCHADDAIQTVVLTTEEEGVALAAGAWLGGERAAILMQSSGAGNCVNMLSLAQECRFPLLMLVTMRGQYGETNPWQVPMGQSTAGILGQAGVIVHQVDDPRDLYDTVAFGAQMAFLSNRAVAVLIGQKLIGPKRFEAGR